MSRLKCSWTVNFGWDAKVGERWQVKEKEQQSGRKKVMKDILLSSSGAWSGVCLATMHGCTHTHTHTHTHTNVHKDQSRTTQHQDTKLLVSYPLWVSFKAWKVIVWASILLSPSFPHCWLDPKVPCRFVHQRKNTRLRREQRAWIFLSANCQHR